MKPFKGYEPKKIASREPLPAGGYVVKILDSKRNQLRLGFHAFNQL